MMSNKELKSMNSLWPNEKNVLMSFRVSELSFHVSH